MERNVTLDYFKIFLSILIITIHIGPLVSSYPHISWLIYQGIARIAVPCFFIINGYYLVKKIDDFAAIKKYILHLLLIYTVWFVIYLPFQIKQIDLILFLKYYFVSPLFHLWYVLALIEGCILLFLIRKRIKNDTVLLILSIVILLAGVFLEPLQPEYHDMKMQIYIVRNGFFMGFPFIFLGYYIHSKNLVKKIKDIYLIPLIILTLITLCIESSLAREIFAKEIGLVHDIYLSLIIFCPAIILLVFKHSNYKKSNTYLSYLGSLASGIYFIHIFVLFELADVEIPYMIFRFAIALLLSVLLSIFIIYINKYIKIFL